MFLEGMKDKEEDKCVHDRVGEWASVRIMVKSIEGCGRGEKGDGA